MSFRRIIACLLLTLAFVARGQEDCTPEPLPYFEDFQSGFVFNNGQSASWWNETYQENDNCWTVCWVNSFEWTSLISFEYQNGVPNNFLSIRSLVDHLQNGFTGRVYHKFAISPQMATAPRRLQFEASYKAFINYDFSNYIILNNGAQLILGFVSDENDCINTFVPFDTLRIDSTTYNTWTFQSFDVDLGRYFDTFPQPWRIGFQGNLTESEDLHIVIDNIRISNDLSEFDCVEYYNDTICQGSGYYQHGFKISPQSTDKPGTRHYSYVNQTGCFINLNLTVIGTHTTTIVDTVPCGQPSPYAPDTVLGESTHYFHLSDRYGCDSLVTITIHQAWVTHLYDSIQEGDTLLFEGQTLTAGGIYTHDTVASDGCDSLVVMHLRCRPLPPVNTDTLAFWFPNVFTPGRDDNNRFGCITTCEVSEFELDIYTRTGLMVYSTHDIHAPWDGTHKGRPVPQGAYVYHYRIRMADMRVRTGAGTVTLLR